MIFTVIWEPTATSQLARVWLNSNDQNAVTLASGRVDQELRVNPDCKGTPYGKYYVMIEDPLAVLYQISEDDRMVSVIAVRESN